MDLFALYSIFAYRQ